VSVGSGVRSGLRGLTVRGRAFLAAGLSAGGVGVLLGQRDLLRVGILLAALPLVSAWVVVRTRYRLACTRRLDPPRVAAGETATVVLRLDNVSRLPTGLLLVEDRLPYALGSRPRFVLDRVEPRGTRSVTYTVRSDVRGRFTLGPLSIRLSDPFGMCELQRSFTSTDTFTVTPAVTPLPDVQIGGEWSGSGESRARSVAAAGEDDVATREYRDGDALHRVHWKSTARQGELMVRREEQPWQSRATLLLDSRALAHRGEGTGASFEWAVSAAASVGVHLVRRGFGLRLLLDTGGGISGIDHQVDGLGSDVEGLLLDTLAVAQPSQSEGTRDMGAALRRSGDTLVVAVLGAVTPEEASELARVRHGSAAAVCVLLDVSTWTHLPAKVRAEATRAYDDVATLLTQSGWRVVRARAGDDLPEVWPGAARGMQELRIPHVESLRGAS
jgi:uncharacterized protein (DUF58 family)